MYQQTTERSEHPEQQKSDLPYNRSGQKLTSLPDYPRLLAQGCAPDLYDDPPHNSDVPGSTSSRKQKATKNYSKKTNKKKNIKLKHCFDSPTDSRESDSENSDSLDSTDEHGKKHDRAAHKLPQVQELDEKTLGTYVPIQ